MKVTMALSFERTVKKFHRVQIDQVEDAIDEIIKNPDLGEMKKGDLAGVQVYKFRINKLLMLLAYIYNDHAKEITLLSVGSHENFYRDLKRK